MAQRQVQHFCTRAWPARTWAWRSSLVGTDSFFPEGVSSFSRSRYRQDLRGVREVRADAEKGVANVDVLFLPSVCDSYCVSIQHSHLAKDVEVFVTNCMNNPRSCSAGVDEMRVLQLFVFFVPTMFSGILGFFGRNSTVLSSFWSACKHG